MEYRTAFVEFKSLLTGPKMGIKVLDGNELARYAETVLNEKHFEGYQFDRIIEVNSSPHYLAEGFLMVFRRIPGLEAH
ncbi:MAG: hypothetical protein AAFV80_01260 [Bacteroidota bacterium]